MQEIWPDFCYRSFIWATGFDTILTFASEHIVIYAVLGHTYQIDTRSRTDGRMKSTSRAVNVQSLQPEITLRDYQNTACSSSRKSNLLQNDNDLTNVPHKILFYGTWCNSCNISVSLHDSKNTLFSPSNTNEFIIHAIQRNGVKKCTKKRFLSNKIIKYFKQCISKHPDWRPH